MMADFWVLGEAEGKLASSCWYEGAYGWTLQEKLSIPIRSNFREGLSCLEYFISTHGARKRLSGYCT